MKTYPLLLSYVLAFVLALGFSYSADASGQAMQLASNDKADKAKKKDKRVCRRIKVTGSRIKERVCRKESEWKRAEDNTRENVERAFEESNRNLGAPDG